MGAKAVTERVKSYKRNFMTLHEKGYSIPEIAEKCNISVRYAYMVLQEIADENNVTREELLKIKNRKQVISYNSMKVTRQLVDSKELLKDFAETLKGIDRISEKIDSMMKL